MDFLICPTKPANQKMKVAGEPLSTVLSPNCCVVFAYLSRTFFSVVYICVMCILEESFLDSDFYYICKNCKNLLPINIATMFISFRKYTS